jgi:hypothetical protein
MAYRRTAISSLLRPVFVTSVIGLTFLPVDRFYGVYSPTVPAAPSLRPLVPSGYLIRCKPVQVYHHHPPFHIMIRNRMQMTKILPLVGAGKTT